MDDTSRPLLSVKPFLLDGLITWCINSNLTPILTVAPHPNRVLPDHLGVDVGELSFNVGRKAVTERRITSDDISFITFFRNSPHPARLVLPQEAWIRLRVKETGQTFSLSFTEATERRDDGVGVVWPEGIALHNPAAFPIIERRRPRATLSLVWNRDKDRRDLQSQPEAGSQHG